MGLRKPPKGGGVELPIVENPAGVEDMAAGTQAINDAGSLIEGTLPEVVSGSTETLSNAGPSHASGNIRMTGTMSQDKILRAGSKVMTMVDGSYFGDASAADVASGKTFTSAAGLKVAGTALTQILSSIATSDQANTSKYSGSTLEVPDNFLLLAYYNNSTGYPSEFDIVLRVGESVIIRSKSWSSQQTGYFRVEGNTLYFPEGSFLKFYYALYTLT